MNPLPLFVFGTLRQGAENHYYLAGRYARWLPATLHNFRRSVAAHGYPTILPMPGEQVAGELYFLLPDSQAATLAECDLLEELPPGQLAGDHYRRITVPVETAEGSYQAWVYAGA
ncbi:MAG: gamma-glutamylcyclotransferase family protein [Planctomycetales bacterium]